MPPLIWALKEGDGQKVEAWLEQVLSEQDRTKKDEAAETYLNLTTTIRSSSEERDETTSGPPRAKDQLRRNGGGPSGGRLSKKNRGVRTRSRGKKSGDATPRQDGRRLQSAEKAGSCARNRTRGHRTFHPAAAQADKRASEGGNKPSPLSAPWKVSASRISLIEEAIRDFGRTRDEKSTGTAANQCRAVEACGEICWACEDYGQNVIAPSFIGCCTRPKFPSHAEHICQYCTDEINRGLNGSDEEDDGQVRVTER